MTETILTAPTSAETTPEIEAVLHTKVAALSREQKVALLTGADFWSTGAVPSIGLRSMVLSDGPAGVRGAAWDERDPSLNLPSGTALAATWDTGLAHDYGEVLAAEARRKGVDIVLGPTINMHRSPRGGRHFEAFSEDPVLAGVLAAAYSRGLQGCGIAAVPKHYVANDSEDERFHVDVRVDDKTLRELYFAPFEMAVRDGRAWGIMSAYNSVNGVTMSENDLLESPLSAEWGFDGLVVSDWTGVRSTVASALAYQDLAMPGPTGPWGDALVEAVNDGRVPESAIDEKVVRLLRLAWRTGALADLPAPPRTGAADHDARAFARRAASASMVLLQNRHELPLAPAKITSLVVIGEAGTNPRTQGGGSASVIAERVVTPLEGLRTALPRAAITYKPGVAVTSGLVPFSPRSLTNPVTGQRGVRVRFIDAEGDDIRTEDRLSAHLIWTGGVPDGATLLEATTHYRAESAGEVEFGVETIGKVRVTVDGVELIEGRLSSLDDAMGTGLLAPPRLSQRIHLDEGAEVRVVVTNDLASRGHLGGAASISFGLVSSLADDDAHIAAAAAAAAVAEIAVVFVGTTNRDESEGSDRTTLSLPGRQDELVRAVVAANPRTIVVVNAGSPVVMPWRESVAAILLVWFPGQEFGDALADVLLGTHEPGGRLPSTWPDVESNVPVLSTTPVDGTLTYSEGVHIGYRAWLRAGRKPAFAFGHGLGYTTFHIGSPEVSGSVDDAEIAVTVRNTGTRAGKYVAQAYLSRRETAVDRPDLWMASFDAIHLHAGEQRRVVLGIPRRAFEHWAGHWAVEPGSFQLHIGEAVDRVEPAGDIVVS